MPQLFPRSSNVLIRVVLWGGLAGAAALAGAADLLYHAPYVTSAGWRVAQPVPFSHAHHVGTLGLDCRYCHTGVERGAAAGMPQTETCMTCHSQLFTDSPVLAPVRESFATGVPIAWQRVHRLPDYVYFDHHIHLAKGVGCVSCHGRVDRMPLTEQVVPMRMGFCLECHRAPATRLRAPQDLFSMAPVPPERRGRGEALVRFYHLADQAQRTSCTTCHR